MGRLRTREGLENCQGVLFIFSLAHHLTLPLSLLLSPSLSPSLSLPLSSSLFLSRPLSPTQGLPAKGRPEEWQQWTSKARWGVRDYSRVPHIGDAADLGIAVTKWVSSFNLADFGKTGLHGMVALLTLMVWWGTAALTPLSWNSDSRPQWQELVLGLSSRYTILLNEFPDHKRSREDDGSGGDLENKRSVPFVFEVIL